MEKEAIKYVGFIAPEIKTDQHLFGDAIPFEILKTDGVWDSSANLNEEQRRRFETYNCTGFNTGKQIRIYLKEKFGIDFNPSDRWIGIIAGTQEPGNDPHRVMEAIREYGLIPEEMLPYSDDLNDIGEYYSFKGADRDACFAEGLKWKVKFLFLHDWVVVPGMVVEDKIKNIKLAIQTAPLSAAFYAWFQNEKGVYIKAGPENHWSLMVSFPDLQNIKDSYDPFDKMADQDILYCKRIYIEKKLPPVVPPEPLRVLCKVSFWDRILQIFNQKPQTI